MKEKNINAFMLGVKQRVAMRHSELYNHYAEQDFVKGDLAGAALYIKAAKYAKKEANQYKILIDKIGFT
jgi:hypothetical protein